MIGRWLMGLAFIGVAVLVVAFLRHAAQQTRESELGDQLPPVGNDPKLLAFRQRTALEKPERDPIGADRGDAGDDAASSVMWFI